MHGVGSRGEEHIMSNASAKGVGLIWRERRNAWPNGSSVHRASKPDHARVDSSGR